MNDRLLRLYHRLPGGARSAAATMRGLSLRRLRYGGNADLLLEEAITREGWSEEQWELWREERLARILRTAAAKVPYYREQWSLRRRRGDNSSVEVLGNWPVLRKDELREHGRAFIAEGCDVRSLVSDHTSGTTGKPLSLWFSKEGVRTWYAMAESRWRHWYGVDRRDRWAILGGQLIAPAGQTEPPFWVWNGGLNQLYMSSYHISPASVKSYVEALKKYDVKYVLGYASALHSLASLALEQGVEAPRLKVAVSNAEPFYRQQRDTVSRAFKCPTRDTYGMSEAVCAASECEAGEMHLWPDAGVLEVLDDDEDRGVPGGATGRLVCTGLVNEVMPLIRYEVGDRGAVAPGGGCSCGRAFPRLLRIEGRLDDVLVTSEGRLVGRLDTVFKADLPVREAQIIQENERHVRVLLVPSAEYGEAAGRLLAQRLRDRLGDVTVEVELVSSIERTRNGKFRAVISKVRGGKPQAGRAGAATGQASRTA